MVNCYRISKEKTLNWKLTNKIFSFKLNPTSHNVHHRFGYKNIIHESILNYNVCKKWVQIYFRAYFLFTHIKCQTCCCKHTLLF